MWDFYHADQGKEETIPSFATKMEQRPLKYHLFHRCKKSIWDSVKYCFTDPHLDYIHFLEECKKDRGGRKGWPS